MFLLHFKILDIQISWHKIRQHKKINSFYWITWEGNTVCYWKLASLYHITKETTLSKNLQELWPEN